MSTNRFDLTWLAYRGTTTAGWDGSIVAGSDADVPLPIVATPAGSSATISVPAGALVLTGYAPTVVLPQTITVPAASLILTGYAPTVLTPRVVLVPSASLTLTGFAPTVTAGTGSGVTVSVPTGALTLTGFAPTIVTPQSVTVPAAALTLTGYAPSVITSSSVDISVPVASLTLTGYAPSVQVGSSLSGRHRRRSRRAIYELEGSKKKCLRRHCARNQPTSQPLLPRPIYLRYWTNNEYCRMH